MALTSSEDPRIKNLATAHPKLDRFLRSFRDAFGQVVQPSVLLVRDDVPATVFHADAVTSFRDLVAISVIPYSLALTLSHRRALHSIFYANTFSLYPWMIDRDYEDLIGRTPAFLGVHEVELFQGQCSPEVQTMILSETDIDKPLLEMLLKRWQRRYAGQRFSWPDRALFRSLNMANHASMMPANTGMIDYDVGRTLALWVSSFEILAHPGGKKWRSDLNAVYELLEKVEWNSNDCKSGRYVAHENRGRTSQRRNLSCWLYGEIYKIRNTYLHGNPIKPTQLVIKGSERSFYSYAAPLYRMALAGFLPLVWKGKMPKGRDHEKLDRYIANNILFRQYQTKFEDALYTARTV